MKKTLSLLLAVLILPSYAGTVDTSEIENAFAFTFEDMRESPNSSTASNRSRRNDEFSVSKDLRILEFPERVDLIVKSASWIRFINLSKAKSLHTKSPCSGKYSAQGPFRLRR